MTFLSEELTTSTRLIGVPSSAGDKGERSAGAGSIVLNRQLSQELFNVPVFSPLSCLYLAISLPPVLKPRQPCQFWQLVHAQT